MRELYKQVWATSFAVEFAQCRDAKTAFDRADNAVEKLKAEIRSRPVDVCIWEKC